MLDLIKRLIKDKIYVFKDGRNVGFFKTEEADESILYDRMSRGN